MSICRGGVLEPLLGPLVDNVEPSRKLQSLDPFAYKADRYVALLSKRLGTS